MGNVLYYGDNLDVLRQHVKDETVDLVYLDPPFNSNQDYNVLFAEHDGTSAAAQIQAFEDTWQWDAFAARAYEEVVESGGRVSDAMRAFRTFLGDTDMLAYLAMMAPRLVELRRVMKPTASIYLHCDPTASHYLKALMDAVFGPQSFENEIIWQRTNARVAAGRWPRLHDTILFYSKDARPVFHPLRVSASPSKMPHTLVTGPDGQKYQSFELTAPHLRFGETGEAWRGFQPAEMGRCWANPPSVMDEWDRQGLIHWPKKPGAWPRRRAREPFEPEQRQVTVGDVWTDVDRINQAAKERLGYPTQKPVALLERILCASSNVGDTVLDPFCGCGTTIDAAQKLDRRWIGIDITHLAVNLIKTRLRDTYGADVEQTYTVVGEPVSVEDARQLARGDPWQFQWWALGLVGARPAEQKKGADKGIDGRILFHDEPGGATKQIVLSVKAGHLHANHVRDLVGVVTRENAAIGVLLSFEEPTKPMRAEAASAGFFESRWGTKHQRIQLLTVGQLLAGARIDYPAPAQTGRTFKRAPKVTGRGTQQTLF